MPPLIEDVESSADEIPHQKTSANGADKGEDNQESGPDDDDVEPDEYVVEKILKHDWLDDGTLVFEVKWMGYEDASDRTWEPESNLETASDVLNAYFEKIGGRPNNPASKEKKSKKRGSEAVAANTPKSGRKKGKLDTPEVTRKGKKNDIQDEWRPPSGSWEKEIVAIDTIEESFDAESGKNLRVAYVIWNNGRKTRHLLTILNQKCPQKMLLYYESHLVFRQSGMNANGETPKLKEQTAGEPKTKRAKMEA